jgi:hypothetical protein
VVSAGILGEGGGIGLCFEREGGIGLFSEREGVVGLLCKRVGGGGGVQVALLARGVSGCATDKGGFGLLYDREGGCRRAILSETGVSASV